MLIALSMFPCNVELDAFNSVILALVSILDCKVLEEVFRAAVKSDSKDALAASALEERDAVAAFTSASVANVASSEELNVSRSVTLEATASILPCKVLEEAFNSASEANPKS